MSSCYDDLEAAMTMAHEAALALRALSEMDPLIQPFTHPGVDDATWGTFQNRFGDKSDTWKDEPLCARAVFWKNYADAINARIKELTPSMA